MACQHNIYYFPNVLKAFENSTSTGFTVDFSGWFWPGLTMNLQYGRIVIENLNFIRELD